MYEVGERAKSGKRKALTEPEHSEVGTYMLHPDQGQDEFLSALYCQYNTEWWYGAALTLCFSSQIPFLCDWDILFQVQDSLASCKSQVSLL